MNTISNKHLGTQAENIFGQSGSAKRILELELIFNSPDHSYGKGIDWDTGFYSGQPAGTQTKGYEVYDAASCLLRYLKLLPEPVIPFDQYDRFTTIMAGVNPSYRDGDYLIDDQFDIPGSIVALQKVMTDLPPLSRQLLLYLLDLLAVVASKSDSNLMNTQRLVTVFQPALLSRPPNEMAAEDHVRAADTMIFMVENQDHFLIGMRQPASDYEKDEAENRTAKPLATTSGSNMHRSSSLPELRNNSGILTESNLGLE